jgi:hypothetical protein
LEPYQSKAVFLGKNQSSAVIFWAIALKAIILLTTSQQSFLEPNHSKPFKFWVIAFKAVLFVVAKQLFTGPKHSTVVIYGTKSSNIVVKLLLSRKYNNFLKLWHQKQILLIGLVIRLNQSNHKNDARLEHS